MQKIYITFLVGALAPEKSMMNLLYHTSIERTTRKLVFILFGSTYFSYVFCLTYFVTEFSFKDALNYKISIVFIFSAVVLHVFLSESKGFKLTSMDVLKIPVLTSFILYLFAGKKPFFEWILNFSLLSFYVFLIYTYFVGKPFSSWIQTHADLIIEPPKQLPNTISCSFVFIFLTFFMVSTLGIFWWVSMWHSVASQCFSMALMFSYTISNAAVFLILKKDAPQVDKEKGRSSIRSFLYLWVFYYLCLEIAQRYLIR